MRQNVFIWKQKLFNSHRRAVSLKAATLFSKVTIWSPNIPYLLFVGAGGMFGGGNWCCWSHNKYLWYLHHNTSYPPLMLQGYITYGYFAFIKENIYFKCFKMHNALCVYNTFTITFMYHVGISYEFFGRFLFYKLKRNVLIADKLSLFYNFD